MLNPRWILVWSLFCCRCLMWLWNSILVKILKLGLVKILKLKFYGEADVWLWFWRWCLIKICVWTCDKNSTLGSVVPLAMFITLSRAKTWYNISFNFTSRIQIISEQKHSFMLPSVSKEYKQISWPLWWWYDIVIWWLTRERAYDNNIRRMSISF